MDTPFELVCDLRARLGEGPVWEATRGSLRLTDILSRKLYRFDPVTGQVTGEDMAEEVGCFALTADGGGVAAMRSGIYDLQSGARCATNPEDFEGSRFNDGTTDPRGRFLVGTVDPGKQSRAALYRYDARGLVRLAEGLNTSNGLAFSPDGRTLYHSDTPRFVVYAYDYNAENGSISNRRDFVRLRPGAPDQGRPDGAAVDAEGCYWTALYQGARVHRYSPEGALLSVHPVPAQSPTMPCFGGPDMKTLFVTSARDGCMPEQLARHPDSGGIFALRTDVPGLVKTPFDPEA